MNPYMVPFLWAVVFLCLKRALIVTAQQYTQPCLKGSLESSGYEATGTYYCTEPVRTIYKEEEVVGDANSFGGINVTTGNFQVYYYPTTNVTLAELYDSVPHQPCNCYSQPIQWKSETIGFTADDTATEGFLQLINDRNVVDGVKEWDPVNDGTPCFYTQLGYSWAVASEELPDPIILTIPPGTTKTVYKTGASTAQYLNADAAPITCGSLARNVYQSVPIPKIGSEANITSGDNFYARPSSKGISDYCLESNFQPNSILSSLDPTARVFKATLMRLATPIEMVRQCRMGMPSALLLYSGFWPYSASSAPFDNSALFADTLSYNSIQDTLLTYLNTQSVFGPENSISLCSGKGIMEKMISIISNTNQYMKYKYGSQSFVEWGQPTCSLSMYYRYHIAPIINYKTSDPTPGISLTANSDGTYKISALPLLKSETEIIPYQFDPNLLGEFFFFNGKFLSIGTLNMWQWKFEDFAWNVDSWNTYINKYGYFILTPGCFDVISKDLSYQFLPKISYPCENSAMLITYIGGFHPPQGIYLKYSCVNIQDAEYYNLGTPPTGGSLATSEGRQKLVEQLRFIVSYFALYDSVYNGGVMEYLANELKNAVNPSVKVNDIVQSDFLSVPGPGSNKIMYGIFDTNSAGALTLDTAGADTVLNPFMPVGTTTNLSACMEDTSLWKDSNDNFLGIAKPGQLQYFTSDQLVQTYQTFFSVGVDNIVKSTFGNGFITNLMYFYGTINFTNIELPSPTSSNGIMSMQNNLEELIGYTVDFGTTSAFYNSIFTETCEFRQDVPGYFLSQGEDVWGREYQVVEVPLYNNIVVMGFDTTNFAVINQTNSNNQPVCYFYGNDYGVDLGQPFVSQVENGSVCVVYVAISPVIQINGGSDASLQGGTFVVGKCVKSMDGVVCACSSRFDTGCNTPPTFAIVKEVLTTGIHVDYEGNQVVYPLIPTADEVDAHLDTLHCLSKTVGRTNVYLEKPLFLNPSYVGTNRTLPPGLTKEQLSAWCGLFSETECSGYNRSDASFNYCMNDYTESPVTCKLRYYDYGRLSKIPTVTHEYNVTDPQCSFWNSELDEPSMCQRRSSFTGCVLVETREVLGNSSSSTAGMRVPNSFRRFVMGPVKAKTRYYDTMYSLVFTVAQAGNVSTNDIDFGNCACRYVNGDGIVNTFNVTMNAEDYTAIDMSLLQHDIVALNPMYYRNVLIRKLDTGIDVTIPVVTRDGTVELDYQRTSVRCGCDTPSLVLAPNVFDVVYEKSAAWKVNSIFAGNKRLNTNNVELLNIDCVPFNEKVKFTHTPGNSDDIGEKISENRVFKTRPIDCNGMSYLTNAGTKVQEEYQSVCTDQQSNYIGMCVFPRSNIQECTFVDEGWYANIGTTIPVMTYWSQSLQAGEAVSGYFFGNSNVNFSSVSSTAMCLQIGTCAVEEFGGSQCTDATTECGLMIDKTYMIPCGVLGTTDVPVCSKPQLQIMYPAFDGGAPDTIGSLVDFPDDVWKWSNGPVFDGEEATNNFKASMQKLKPAYWDAQLTMVHYCDTYYDKFVYCENDPYSSSMRALLCSNEYNASVLYAGTTLNAFALQDICPFVFDTTFPRECFVFPGSANFGSVRAILNVLETQYSQFTGTGITFYYVPFSVAAVKNLFMNAAFSETRMTNRFSSFESIFITPDNRDETGANAQKLSNPMLSAIEKMQALGKGDNTIFSSQQSMCNRQIPMSTTTIELFYYAIESTFNANTGLYEFVSVTTSLNQTTQNIVTMRPSEVFPIIYEAGTTIQQNNVKILPALPSGVYPIVFSALPGLEMVECTRFIIDAQNIVIGDLTFDQSGCIDMEESEQIPIVFSGEYADNGIVTGIVTINAPAVVAMYGGSAKYFSYDPYVQGQNFTVSDIDMQYTSTYRSRYISSRNNVGVFGKTIGTIGAEECTDIDCLVSTLTVQENAVMCNVRYCGCDIGAMCVDVVSNTMTGESSVSVCSNDTDAQSFKGFESVSPDPIDFLQMWMYSSSKSYADTYIGSNGIIWTLNENFDVVVAPYDSAGIGFVQMQTEEAINLFGSAHVYQAEIIDTAKISDTLLKKIDYGVSFCLMKDENKINVSECFEDDGSLNPNLLRVYTSGIDNAIHESGRPYMCFTARTSVGALDITQRPNVYLEPCTPCNIGIETHIRCVNSPLSQWIVFETNESVEFNITSDNTVPTVYVGTPGQCLTRNLHNNTLFYSACDSCLWEKEKFAVGQDKRAVYESFCSGAVGIERYACNPLSTAGLYDVLFSNLSTSVSLCEDAPSNVVFGINGNKFGIGATGICIDGNLQFIRRGYGYFAGDVVQGYNNYITDTQKILIQPYSYSGFNVAAQGQQVINISTYTNFFGKAYEADVFAEPLTTKPAFLALNIVLGIVNALLLVLHIGLIFYEDELKEKYAIEAVMT